MAHLTKMATYDIEDSNIALLGSDLEKHVREESGKAESAWDGAGSSPGLQTWRIEKFQVKPWPEHQSGYFYTGDSYIVLHTYKRTPDATSLSYDLHFWLGSNTTQDEAGTAAYKTVELDDFLDGRPVQFREVQDFESPRFLSYFPRFVCLQGGVATGFHHVSEPPPQDIMKLYRINISHIAGHRSNLVVREVPAEAKSLVEGDVYVLDKGSKVLQFNTKTSEGKEKYNAAEFVLSLANGRQGQCDIAVYDEGGSGSGAFLGQFGEGTTLRKEEPTHQSRETSPILFRLSDSTGKITFERVDPPAKETLSSSDAFLLDNSGDPLFPAIYVWIGKNASLNERRLSLQYAQRYLYNKKTQEGAVRDHVHVAIPIVKMEEGSEAEDFLHALAA